MEKLSCDLCVFVTALSRDKEGNSRKEGSDFTAPISRYTGCGFSYLKAAFVDRLYFIHVVQSCDRSVMVFGVAIWLFFVSGFCCYGMYNMFYSRVVLHRLIVIFKLIIQYTNCLVISRDFEKGRISQFKCCSPYFQRFVKKKRTFAESDNCAIHGR